jgi:hypothetical protein
MVRCSKAGVPHKEDVRGWVTQEDAEEENFGFFKILFYVVYFFLDKS